MTNNQMQANNNLSKRGHNPEEDGITHINIHYSPYVGKTSLGQWLSNFVHMPFCHPHYGSFNSIEGFWHYLRNRERDDDLRYLSYRRAYDHGRAGVVDMYPEFREDILAGIYQKILQTRKLHSALVQSTLPFDMYYRFGPSKIIVTPKWSDWLVDGIEDIRKALIEDKIPDVWLRAEERYQRGELRR